MARKNDKEYSQYTRACEHCTREIPFAEVEIYFQNNTKDVLEELNSDLSCIIHGVPLHNITTRMPCPNCEQWIENIEVEVDAVGEWDSSSDDSDDRRMPTCYGFFDCDIRVLWPEFDNDPLAREDFLASSLEEDQTLNNQSLLMIVKTKSNKGHCYLGLSLEDQKIYRPIYCEAPGQCCWPKAIPMQVGAFYGFKKTFRNPKTKYPHKSNDIVVTEELKVGNSEPNSNLKKMHEHLLPFAKTSVQEIFNDKLTIQENGKCYAFEGTKCQSFGILKAKPKSLAFDMYKKRLKFSDSTNQTFDISWTSIEDLERAKERANCGEDVLIILGLARPWNANGNFSRPRCYLLAIGLEVWMLECMKIHFTGL